MLPVVLWILLRVPAVLPADAVDPRCESPAERFLVHQGRELIQLHPMPWPTHFHRATRRCYLWLDDTLDATSRRTLLFDLTTRRQIATILSHRVDDRWEVDDAMDDTTDALDQRVRRYVEILTR